MPQLHVRCPQALGYVWQWFCALHRTRDGNEAGPSAITYTELGAWSQLTRIRPTPSEVDMIQRIDMEYLESVQKRRGHGQ